MRFGISVVAAAVVFAGCNAPSTSVASGADTVARSAQNDAGSDRDATDRARSLGGTGSKGSSLNSDVEARQYRSAKLGRPVKTEFPYPTDLDIRATLDRVCTEVGDKVTLTVETPPKAAVAYQAVYSDNRGGADKPLGGGYGGNDKGYADDNGVFTDSWIIGPEAPAGIARVDVIVGFEDKWGYDDPELIVASPNGNGGPREC